MDLKGQLGNEDIQDLFEPELTFVGPVPTQYMQAAKIRTGRGIAAYTGNLAMKIQVSCFKDWDFCLD